MEAFLNAASKFEARGELQSAEWTRRALTAAKLPMFMRSEEDIREDRNPSDAYIERSIIRGCEKRISARLRDFIKNLFY